MPAWQDIFVIEPNPTTAGAHIHMWQWGGRVDDSEVGAAAIAAGMGERTYAEPSRLSEGAPTSYGFKTILSTPAECGITREIETFFNVNGGRLAHATRNFWRDDLGRPLAGFRAADRYLRERQSDGDQWVVVRR